MAENSNNLNAAEVRDPKCTDKLAHQVDEENVVLVYQNLRNLAHSYLRNSKDVAEIQPTALVHEAYLKLGKVEGLSDASATKYFAYAAKAMRQILLNYYRKFETRKRGGELHRTRFEESTTLSLRDGDQVLAVNEALEKLYAIDELRANIVEMRFFGGMKMAEIAEVTGKSVSTVKQKWAAAKMWLRAELAESGNGPKSS